MTSETYSIEEDRRSLSTNKTNSALSWIFWLSCALFFCYQFLLRVVPNIIRHDVMKDFQVTAGTLGALWGVGYFAYTAMQIPSGLLVDRFGVKRLATIAVLVCAFGTYLFATTDSIFIAKIGRFLYGGGAACALVCCAKVASMWFDESRASFMIGLTIFVGVLGAVFGGEPMAWLVKRFGWREALQLMVYVGIGLAIAIFLIVRDNKDHISSSTHHEDTSEKKSIIQGLKDAILTPQISLIALYAFCVYMPLSIFADAWGGGLLEKIYGMNEAQAGNAISLMYIGLAVGAPFFGWLGGKYTNEQKIFLFIALSLFALTFLLIWVPSVTQYILLLILFTMGFIAGSVGLLFTAACRYATPVISGSVIGFVNMSEMLSGSIFQPIVGYVLDFLWDGNLVDNVPNYNGSDYQIALSIILVGLAICIILTFFFKKNKQ